MNAPLMVDPVLFILLVLVIADLTDALDSCRTNVEAEQASHAAYRLTNPPRKGVAA
ncbi:hypothetical protein [Streptomyces sp. NPDC097640]|uniref:hypothetical protein n=1 Tax=Streptomyces sp. NPDC097640 TaxID=3157229 RepID=UPI0033192C2A